MASTILHKRSNTVGKVPTNLQLEYGEIAINYADGIVYMKHDDDTVHELARTDGRQSSHAETVETVASAAGVLTLDFSTTNHFEVTLTENITSVVFANAPAGDVITQFTIEFIQDATGGFTVTGYPASAKWSGGTEVTITATPNKVDVISGYVRGDGSSVIRLYRMIENSD